MTSHYEVRSGRRVVSTRTAASARDAAFDYVRSVGCSRDEVTYLGTDAVAWRGAIYRAAEARAVPSHDRLA